MQADKIISPQQFRELTNLSRSTEWRLARDNMLPPRVIINGRTLGYRESDYHDWLNSNTVIK